ncbi:hypothetical protein WJX74_010176 [Apatococcus lobatus]|uniref:Uncharacterized protein n=1 Tax=Apatococcus lobatus TaxID=904363 RepID=A0AAW1RPY6_9CHLO
MSDSLNKEQTSTSDQQLPTVQKELSQHGSPPLAAAKLHLNPKADTFTPSGSAKSEAADPRTDQQLQQSPELPQQNLQPAASSSIAQSEGQKHRGKKGPEGAHAARKQQGGLSRELRSHRDSRRQGHASEAGPTPSGHAIDQHLHDGRQEPSHSHLHDAPLGRSPSRGHHIPANFLLNFRRDQYNEQGGRRGGGGAGRGRSGSRRLPPKPQPYNRNKFLQANFRFLVSDAADLRRHAADADLMLDWDDVVEVEMLAPAPLRCPISLDCPPVCPQITPCGHVFSFHAILQHLVSASGSEGTTPRAAVKCPLCFTQFSCRELRLVRVLLVQPLQVGKDITLRLIKRPRDSILATALCSSSPRHRPLKTDHFALGQSPPKDSHSTPTRPIMAANGNMSSTSSTSGSAIKPPAKIAAAQEASARPDVTAAIPKASGKQSAGSETRASAGKSDAAATALSKAASARHPPSSETRAGTGPVQGKTVQSVAWQVGGKSSAAGVMGVVDHTTSTNKAADNQFAKFTPLSDAGPLWQAAATELADYATLVTTEGGFDAATEAPFVYGALDALASRSAAWAERRQHLLLEHAPPDKAASMAEPHVVAADAAAAVKQVSRAAVMDSSKLRSQVAAEAQHYAAFPALAPAPQPLPPGPAAPGLPKPAEPMQQTHQAAFSDDDEASPTHGAQQADARISGAAADAAADDAFVEHHNGPAQQTSSPSKEPAAGTSPGTSSSSSQQDPHQKGGNMYFYQAADGQWVFLHPLDMRALLSHYGSFEACPHTLTAPLQELEEMTQEEHSRRRLKHLAHLPLGGAYKLGEVNLTSLLPAESLAPFQSELAAREKRRERRALQAAAAADREAAQEAALIAAGAAPSAAELLAMPRPGPAPEDEAGALWFDESANGEGSSAEQVPPPQAGISFAHMARMGFAATGPSLTTPGTSPQGQPSAWGPALGHVPAPGSSPPPTSGWGSAGSAWASKPAGNSSVSTPSSPSLTSGLSASKEEAGSGKKSKKSGRNLVLLSSSAQQRRY